VYVNIVLLILVVIVSALNIKATLVLARSQYYETKQKLVQLALVWLIPVLGAILVWGLATDSPGERITTDLTDHLGIDDGNLRLANYSPEGGGDGGGDGGGGGGGGGGD